jgi:hypothetical protein
MLDCYPDVNGRNCERASSISESTMMRRTGLVLVALSILIWMSRDARAQAAGKSDDAQERTQVGRGKWIQHGHAQQPIGKVTLRDAAGERLRADFLLENGTRRRLEGTVAHRDETGLRIKIGASGDANAGGYLQVETAAKHGIRSMYGAGKVDGQAFYVQFTDRYPLRLNALAEGVGSWAAKGGSPAAILGCGLMLDGRLRAEVSFFLADEKLRRVAGAVKSQDPTTGTYVIVLKHSGMADASGQIRVRVSAKHNIIRAEGDVMLDGQAAHIQFDARIDAKIRASILETDAARMRTVEGQRTVGDAATKFTAHVDETGVRYIEAELNQGDYGSSHRKMYFERGKLFYFSEQGQLRNTSAKSAAQMNLVELSLSFTPEGKLQGSAKSVNGKAVKLAPHDASGAASYAEALRKAAEEKLAK